MDAVLFWTWAPGLLILVAVFGLIMDRVYARERDKHRHDPAE